LIDRLIDSFVDSLIDTSYSLRIKKCSMCPRCCRTSHSSWWTPHEQWNAICYSWKGL